MLAIIGDLGYDIHPRECGARTFFGGSGFHAAAGAIAAVEKCPALLGCVGRDFDLPALAKYGFNTDYIVQKDDVMSTRFYIYYGDNNVRNVVFEMGASQYECVERMDDSVISCDLVHLTATRPEKQLRYIEALRAKGFSGSISADVFDQFCRDSRSQVLDVLDACDIIFVSAGEREILGITPQPYCQKGKMLILKKAEAGAECYAADQFFRGYSPLQGRVIDTTGAGDIMAGAFLSLLDAGKGVQQALDLSVALATRSVRFLGSEAFLSAMQP